MYIKTLAWSRILTHQHYYSSQLECNFLIFVNIMTCIFIKKQHNTGASVNITVFFFNFWVFLHIIQMSLVDIWLSWRSSWIVLINIPLGKR